MKSACIAYLAPEIPALSATFVYEEIFAVEKQGIDVIAITVRKPQKQAALQEALINKVLCLYDEPALWLGVKGIISLPRFKQGAITALQWLVKDIGICGLSVNSLKLAFQFLVATKLARFLKEKNCQHLHVHFAHVPTQIAMYASAMSGVPFTVMAHANDIFERGLLLPQKAGRSVKFLTISEYNSAFLQNIGVHPDKLAVVRCGVSFNMRSKPESVDKKNSFTIGTLGRLVEKKGVDVLIRAVSLLKDKPYKIKLSIAGDGSLRNELEALAQELNMQESVCFVGSLAHNQVAEWMQNLDAFVLACKADANGDMDGIPVVLMEAMSQAIPVISTHLSGIPELVIHEQTGLLAKSGDSQDLALQIDRLLNSQTLQTNLVNTAQKHVVDEFSQKINIERLIQYFPCCAQDM